MQTPPGDPAFHARIANVFGERGSDWLARLPQLLAECERRWDLTLEAPYSLGYNYVAPAGRGDGAALVLKAGVPRPELSSEIAALRHYDGRAAVRLIAADEDAGLLLLERIAPGVPLAELRDDAEATRIAARLMRALWRPLPAGHRFPSIADWGQAFRRIRDLFHGSTGPLPARIFGQAESLLASLLASQSEPALLHGDLHHWNILRAERTPWLALDPKGVAGEPAYEVGTWMRNRIGESGDPSSLSSREVRRLLAARLDLFAGELVLDRQRLLGWSLAQAVLSACWTIEDHETGWEPAIAIAEHLAAM